VTRRTVGVVLAGGVGTRLGLPLPKQLIKVAGRTILEHTVGLFEASPRVDEIIVMVTPGWAERIEETLGGAFSKVSKIVEGGVTRNDTTRIALAQIPDDDAKVLLHDAVRPLLDESTIAACVDALDLHDAVDVVIPSADTLVEVGSDGFIRDVPDRSQFRRGQTPQAFRVGVLKHAYEVARDDPNFQATDDCAVVLRYLPEVPIATVAGSDENIKITYPVDLVIADRLFQLASQQVGEVDEEQRAAALAGKVIVIFGAGSGIGAEMASIARAAGATVVGHSRSFTEVDIRKRKRVARALAAAAQEFGRIDAVVVTAGVLHTGQLVDVDFRQVKESLAINLRGPIVVARESHRYLAQSDGHLLFFTSSSYTRGRSNYALYSSTKAAIVNLTQALADEWSDDGIKVNVVNPERTATPMRTRAFGEEESSTLLTAEQVALTSLDILATDATGLVFDVRLPQGR